MKTKQLTKTQQDLLAVLRHVKAVADATDAEADARAIGGLTEVEKFRRGAKIVCGGYVTTQDLAGNTHRANSITFRTWQALVDAGLAERGPEGSIAWIRAI